MIVCVVRKWTVKYLIAHYTGGSPIKGFNKILRAKTCLNRSSKDLRMKIRPIQRPPKKGVFYINWREALQRITYLASRSDTPVQPNMAVQTNSFDSTTPK